MFTSGAEPKYAESVRWKTCDCLKGGRCIRGALDYLLVRFWTPRQYRHSSLSRIWRWSFGLGYTFCLGQVTKLVLDNSLETRILDMQEHEAAYSSWAKPGCVRLWACLGCFRNKNWYFGWRKCQGYPGPGNVMCGWAMVCLVPSTVFAGGFFPSWVPRPSTLQTWRCTCEEVYVLSTRYHSLFRPVWNMPSHRIVRSLLIAKKYPVSFHLLFCILFCIRTQIGALANLWRNIYHIWAI